MKITTIYAAKILGYITQRDRLVTAGEIVEHVGISYQYALKIMNEMKRAGLLESEQGCRGGYRLGNEKEDVSAYDVVALLSIVPVSGTRKDRWTIRSAGLWRTGVKKRRRP